MKSLVLVLVMLATTAHAQTIFDPRYQSDLAVALDALEIRVASLETKVDEINTKLDTLLSSQKTEAVLSPTPVPASAPSVVYSDYSASCGSSAPVVYTSSPYAGGCGSSATWYPVSGFSGGGYGSVYSAGCGAASMQAASCGQAASSSRSRGLFRGGLLSRLFGRSRSGC